jgi:glycosyltransferase involved in cell wall biosynthesis
MYERWMYKKASALIFSMEGCREYLFERGFKNVIDFSKVFYINMGVDIKLFDSNLVEFIYDDPQLVRKDIFKVVYCGSVRYVNNLKLLCDVAYEIQKSGVSDIYLMIHGGGDQVDNLIQYCIDREISNIKFYGWIEKEKIPYVLAHADLTVLNYNNSPLLRFGGSMNKMFEYFASGKPVLTNVQMGYSLIERYHCGLEVNSDLPEKIADGIMKFYNMSEETREEYGRNSRKAAMDFDVPILCQRLGVVIDYVFQNREEGGV